MDLIDERGDGDRLIGASSMVSADYNWVLRDEDNNDSSNLDFEHSTNTTIDPITEDQARLKQRTSVNMAPGDS